MRKKTKLRRCVCLLLAVLALLALGRKKGRGERAGGFSRLPGAVLVVDAGHGGEDGGAVSPAGTVESQINLAVALRMDALLDLYGVEHLLTRDSDRSLHDEGSRTLREKKVSDLHNRVELVEKTQNSVLISVHQNTFTNVKYHGAQVFYTGHKESLSLAQLIQDTLREALDPDNARVPAKIPSSVYLMNHVTCPAVLVECGFLSDPEEDALLRTGAYQTKLAMALTASYITYQETTKEEHAYESG